MIALFAALALARPDDPSDLYAYDPTDQITSIDDEGVRVWFSTSGPNAVLPTDDDHDDVPDLAAAIGAAAVDVLAFWSTEGLRAPLSDGGEGGSDAIDIYLVDFAGQADGWYSAEDCDAGVFARHCSGYLAIENDFVGYGYPDLDAAVTTLVSHELFHAIQAAYDASEGVWWSEGTAVWAERAYDPENEDFLAFCDAYLEDPERSLDRPPTGPVPTWAYGTALWWWFLADKHGDGVIGDLLEASEASDGIVDDLGPVIAAAGGDLDADWVEFARWNASTGPGADVGYPFADVIGPPDAADAQPFFAVEHRYYPLAASYFVWEHPGGPAAFALDAAAPDLSFSLHPLDGQRPGEAYDEWIGADTLVEFGDLPAGRYWLVAARTAIGEDSVRVLTCLGSPDDVAACAPEDPEPKGCGCATGPTPSSAALSALAALVSSRRRPRQLRDESKGNASSSSSTPSPSLSSVVSPP